MIPDEILEHLDFFLKQVKDNSKVLKSGETDKVQAYNIIRYLQENFEYDLDVERGEGDPVVDFLFNTRKGHCELFAASLTLLLRRCGIPARYVTGFVCQEQHPSGEYYVARLGTAHAWVEAYMRDEGRWVMLEPTPASGIPNYSHEWGVVETWTDRMKQAFQSVLADMRRGYFAKAIVAFCKKVLKNITFFLFLLFYNCFYTGFKLICVGDKFINNLFLRRSTVIPQIVKSFNNIIKFIRNQYSR